MGKYGETAILATALITKRKVADPVEAWKHAASQVFHDWQSSRNKNCPKSTYLGLCEHGLVVGVPAGSYTRSIDNKRYALEAVKQLRINPAFADHEITLWASIMGGETKS